MLSGLGMPPPFFLVPALLAGFFSGNDAAVDRRSPPKTRAFRQNPSSSGDPGRRRIFLPPPLSSGVDCTIRMPRGAVTRNRPRCTENLSEQLCAAEPGAAGWLVYLLLAVFFRGTGRDTLDESQGVAPKGETVMRHTAIMLGLLLGLGGAEAALAVTGVAPVVGERGALIPVRQPQAPMAYPPETYAPPGVEDTAPSGVYVVPPGVYVVPSPQRPSVTPSSPFPSEAPARPPRSYTPSSPFPSESRQEPAYRPAPSFPVAPPVSSQPVMVQPWPVRVSVVDCRALLPSSMMPGEVRGSREASFTLTLSVDPGAGGGRPGRTTPPRVPVGLDVGSGGYLAVEGIPLDSGEVRRVVNACRAFLAGR
ncbi:unnamed protein product [Pararhodospirillum photometricum DSM 122]|uniref:Uncharacterized protein n=2 Tax=Pararhodospirillum photometricum TaxID=1084 RepID=H6SNK9_PARPM|nr:unnamed protein product [Pararhodospirillum photometricum DSM 122]